MKTTTYISNGVTNKFSFPQQFTKSKTIASVNKQVVDDFYIDECGTVIFKNAPRKGTLISITRNINENNTSKG